MDDDPDPGDPGHGVLARGQQELQDGGQQLPHGGGQVQLQHGGTARAASVGAVSRADEEGTAVVGERAAVVAEVADGAATAAPDEVATEVRDRALARPAGAVEATAGAEESAAGAAETADGVARAAREAGSDGDAAVPPQPHDEVLPAPLRPTPMQHSRELSGAAKARAFLEEPCSPIINSQPLLPPLPPGPTLTPPPQQPDRNSPSQRRSTTEGESQRRGGLKFHTPTYVSPAALLPAPSAQPAPGDPHMGSSPSNPPPDEPSPLQAHGGGFTGAILPHQHLVAAQDDALPTKMEVVGVGVDRMTGEDEAALISHTPLPTTACSPTLLPTAQLRGLEGELRPMRQPHATQPHGPAVLHFSLTGPGHPPSLTDLEASKPSSGLRAAVSDLLAIRNTGIPLPTPTPPAPVVHAHEAPLMDLPLAAPILQEPFHPSPMETDLIFRPVLGGYLDILFAILARVSQDPEAPGPTLLLAAAPTLLLAPTTPPERSNTAAIAARIIRFGRGEWDELISEALHRRTPLPLQSAWHARTTTFSPTLDDRRIARCLRLAACNETSRACAAPESAEAAPDTENIVRHLRELGLAVQPHKCLVYGRDFVTSREVEAFTSLEIEVARRGLTVTGVPVGSDAFVERSLPERLERMGRVLPWLPRLRQPQTAARLLSACVSTRPQYLARTVPPTPAVRASFARWDERLGETFQQLLVPGTWTCREDVREAALDKIYLPICLGGFGIRRMERIAPGAGAGAWLTAVPYADSLRIPEAQWQVASAFHLGLPIPQLALAGRCSCGQAIDDLTVPHHEVRCSRFGVATVIHDTVKYMLREFASEVSFAVKVEDTTLILHLDAARARLQGLSGTGDGVPGQSGAPWGQQQQQGGLGRGAGGQEGREGQDGLASGGEEGGQQQQRQQQLGQQGQEGQTRRGEERGQHGQQQRGQQGQEGLASGGEESGQQQQQSQQRQQQQQGQRQQVCRGEERGQKRQHQEGQQGQQGRQQEGQHGERREGQQGQPGWEEERIQQQQRRQ
ncbi:unnamed protein product [Closterium sp. NIES-65]|nr:unnamed protein product [Closterium sp. NIES-65]